MSLRSLTNKKDCRNYKALEIMTQTELSRFPDDTITKLSDGYCYRNKNIAMWIKNKLSSGLRIGHPNFFLPTHTPITREDLDKLMIDYDAYLLPPPVEDVPSDIYGPLNVWSINRASIRNPGGSHSRYNRDGTLRDEETIEILAEENILDAVRNLYSIVFDDFAPTHLSAGELQELIQIEQERREREER